MKKLLGIVMLSFLAACSQSMTDTGGAEATSDVSNPSLQSPAVAEATPEFAPSAFSKAVSISKDGKYLRFDFDFFPDGRDVNFKSKVVSIPCSFLSHVPEGVDVELSAPIEAPCTEPYKISFAGAGEAITLDGIVVPVESAREKFVELFGFRVLPDGVEDSFDGVKIDGGLGRLEDFYAAVLEKHPAQ